VARLPPTSTGRALRMTQESREEACRRGHLALRLVCALTAMTLTPRKSARWFWRKPKRGELSRGEYSPNRVTKESGCVAIPDRARGAAARPGTRRSAVRKALIGAGRRRPSASPRPRARTPSRLELQRGAADNDLPRNNAKRASQIYSTFSSPPRRAQQYKGLNRIPLMLSSTLEIPRPGDA